MFLMEIYPQDHGVYNDWRKYMMSYIYIAKCFPSVLRSWGIRIVNSSLISINVAQDSRIFCMNHNYRIIFHVLMFLPLFFDQFLH